MILVDFGLRSSWSLFEKEIEAGNMKPGNMVTAFKISFRTNQFCKSLEKNIEKAIQVYHLESKLEIQPQFINCE